MADDDTLSLPDLLEALTDAAGLLDQIAEHLVHHRHAAIDAGQAIELHSVEDFTSQGWAYTRQARTTLQNLLAVKDAERIAEVLGAHRRHQVPRITTETQEVFIACQGCDHREPIIDGQPWEAHQAEMARAVLGETYA